MSREFLADFHMHSTFSDGRMTVPELVDLYGSRGFGAIAITDHLCENSGLIGRAAGYLGRTLTPANFPLYREIILSEAERAWREYRMVVIPGFELTKNSLSNQRSAHILALGVSEFIGAEADPLELIRRIHANRGLAIAAHPVSTRKIEKQTYHLWDRREELRHHFDAWEAASGPYLFDEVLGSGLPILASGDLHHRGQLESWKTVLSCERSVPAIFQAIRDQKLRLAYYFDEVENHDDPAADPLGVRLQPDPVGNLARAPAL